MPKYTFICPVCNHKEQTYTPSHVREVACEACCEKYYEEHGETPKEQTWMKRQPPTLNQSEKDETIDKYFGTKQRPDQRDLVEQRRDEFYWTVEVPRMVNSGTYTVETMLEMGWVYIDDKGQIQINTKPPHKR